MVLEDHIFKLEHGISLPLNAFSNGVIQILLNGMYFVLNFQKNYLRINYLYFFIFLKIFIIFIYFYY